MAGPKKIEISKTLYKFLNNKMAGTSIEELSKKTGYNTEDIKLVVEGKKNPSYNMLMDISKSLEISCEEIKDIIEKDDILLFKYWNNLYKDEEPIQSIKYLLKEIMYEKGMKLKDITEIFGVSPSYASSILSGQYNMTYNSLSRFASALGKTPMEILERMRGRKKLLKIRNTFSSKITDARKKKGYSLKEASKACNIAYSRYPKIEMAELNINEKTLARLCKGLDLDMEEMSQLAISSRIILDIEACENLVEGNKWYKIEKNEEKYDFNKKLLSLCEYEFVKMGERVYKSKDIITLFLLILTDSINGQKKYENSILYYLENIEDISIEKYKHFIIFESLKYGKHSLSEVFEYYKKNFSLSFQEISRMSGYSKGYISNKNQANNFDLEFIEKVFTVTGIPYCYAINLFIDEYLSKNNVSPYGTYDIKEILEEIKKNNYVYYNENIISSKIILNIFDKIFKK